jgi:NO-binding membrane sensor protein with MHYT domain
MTRYSVEKVQDPLYILYTFFVSAFSAYVTICLYEQYRLCYQGFKAKLLNRHISLILMAFALGGVGMWAMHWLQQRGKATATSTTLIVS